MPWPPACSWHRAGQHSAMEAPSRVLSMPSSLPPLALFLFSPCADLNGGADAGAAAWVSLCSGAAVARTGRAVAPLPLEPLAGPKPLRYTVLCPDDLAPTALLFFADLAAAYSSAGCGPQRPAPACGRLRKVQGVAPIPRTCASPGPTPHHPPGAAGWAQPTASTAPTNITNLYNRTALVTVEVPATAPAARAGVGGGAGATRVQAGPVLHPVVGACSNQVHGFHPGLNKSWGGARLHCPPAQPAQPGATHPAAALHPVASPRQPGHAAAQSEGGATHTQVRGSQGADCNHTCMGWAGPSGAGFKSNSQAQLASTGRTATTGSVACDQVLSVVPR
ncbi:hypothetical protein HaLaN_19944 [Haematococcus lacustris]|uniref:Uncharacterized protein n=1 Tax=Haematococcus lacustris TaxID=44745 RepID=A0A699ZJI8_HAELA|nr:hypothetical protein HaLaN_19944 [Haematococcus lacustris]